MRVRVIAALIALSISSFGCRAAPTEAPRTSIQSAAFDEVERNKAVVRRWVEEAHNKRNLSVVDEIYTADYRGHMSGGDSFDLEQGRKMEQSFQTDFPTHRVSIDDLFGDRDRVVSRWTLSATHKSGKHVVLRGMTISRFANGKIAEEWMSMDNLSLMTQLGAQP
jgi:predicted ester cyclase